jgi:mono/diheme cytochrome c family protein
MSKVLSIYPKWFQAPAISYVGVIFLMMTPAVLFAGDEQRVEELIKTTCASCHKFEGNPESRFNLQAPDLMGTGSKFQRTWLIGWLRGQEPTMYDKGYRWDLSQQPLPHPTVSQEQAEDIADYFERHLIDPSVRKGVLDLTTFSEIEATFGEQIFKDHSCISCHQIEASGKKTGGSHSTSFVNAGKRLKVEWIYRFNSNPPDFVPHSGEFVADVSELGLRYVTGFIATRGIEDFPFYQPWKSPEFAQASVQRGSQIYKEYCGQCHGFTGQGDGPAASDLEPKPAIHANIPFAQLPEDYLYNVIYYGGKGVGKSAMMPYWGLTIGGKQGVADVIAYLKDTFKGKPQMTGAEPGETSGPLGVCPQPRKTKKAPEKFLPMTNPLPASKETIQAGKTLYHQTAKPLACSQCHGEQADGRGPLGASMFPAPRNFTCGETMNKISDGQLFWIIKNGSPGTGMMAFSGLPDEEIWQLIHYIRQLSQ